MEWTSQPHLEAEVPAVSSQHCGRAEPAARPKAGVPGVPPLPTAGHRLQRRAWGAARALGTAVVTGLGDGGAWRGLLPSSSIQGQGRSAVIIINNEHAPSSSPSPRRSRRADPESRAERRPSLSPPRGEAGKERRLRPQGKEPRKLEVVPPSPGRRF